MFDSPSKDALADLRNQWGHIYEVQSSQGSIYYRGLTWNEFNDIIMNSFISSYRKEELIFNSCVVWPPKISVDDVPPGLVTYAADAIVKDSGMTDPEIAQNTLNEYREKAQTIHTSIKAVLLSQFELLRLTEDDIDNMTFEQSAEKLVLCEQIMQIQKAMFNPEYDVPSFNIIEQEETTTNTEQPEEFDDHPNYKPSTEGTARADDPIARALKGL